MEFGYIAFNRLHNKPFPLASRLKKVRELLSVPAFHRECEDGRGSKK